MDNEQGAPRPLLDPDWADLASTSATTQPRVGKLDHLTRKAIVNVASVPQRSPFRYPGGKTWLIPHVRQWLRSFDERPRLLVEPFAGGAIVSLTAVMENLVDRALMVELDSGVCAVWKAILEGDAIWLADAVEGFDISEVNVRRLLESQPRMVRDLALQTLVRNRVGRGGILAPGAGIVKRGENGHGLRSRWYPATLSRRIRAIAAVRDRLEVICDDGLEHIEPYGDDRRVVFFIDPPYTVAGRRLYTHNRVDHCRLFALTSNIKGDFLMTYDDSPMIARLAAEHSLQVGRVPMKTTHHDEKLELLVGRDLGWLTGGPDASKASAP